MKTRLKLAGLSAVVLGALMWAIPGSALWPAEDLVFDANILWDNDGGSFATTSGGAGCSGGPYTTAQIATVVFDNKTIDPMLRDPYNITDPSFDPMDGSPAIAGNPNSRVLRPSDIDPWFEDVCYVGAVPYTGGDASKDWTKGWTYFNYAGGAGRTDLNPGNPVKMITSNITSNTVFHSDTTYALVGRIGVNPPATLTIEPGTVVVGSGVGSYLVVERDADIMINGTKAAPVILTSGSPAGSQAPGDWGGVVIHGNAVANCASADGCGLTTVDGDCESEGGAGFFGGSDDNDSSGSITYARVEYAGQEIAPNNELNAWTFNAVGRNTNLEYMQAHLGTDDTFEFFGGTARLKHAIGSGGDDDNCDWQMGFRGFVQFFICSQADSNITANAERGIEADNNEFDYNCTGRSNPVVCNLTLVGTGPNGGGGQGIELRRGTAATVINSIILGFQAQGLRFSNDETFANCPGTGPSEFSCASLGIGDEIQQNGLLLRAAPNPTAGPATISFTLQKDGQVRVQVFTVAGRLVDTVVDRNFTSGPHSVTWNPANTGPGMYFYKVTTKDEVATGKLVVS